MERLEAFEKMLADTVKRSKEEKDRMSKLKAEGKEKSATYRQLMGNRLMYIKIMALYDAYGLIDNKEDVL